MRKCLALSIVRRRFFEQMGWASLRRTAYLVFFLPLILIGSAYPSKSASALAAWALEREGVLQLRTSVNTPLKASFQSSDSVKGIRVWIDFPGELTRPRTLLGSGPVREIRLGKPKRGVTRLVIEFKKSVYLDPSKLKLIGISPDRWKLKFLGLPLRGLSRIGEGDLTAFSSRDRDWVKAKPLISGQTSFNSSGLPWVPRGRFRVVIDPGHGGPDSGAVGIGGIRETDVVLDISLEVAKFLEAKGVIVNLTRTSEVDLGLFPRVAIANRAGADAFVSIHANATRNRRRDVNGIETFYFSGFRGLSLSKHIQKQVLKVSPGSPDRGVRRARFFVIRRTRMPAALVETGFVTGRLDAPRLAKASHRRELAFAIAKGILNYLQGLS